MPEQPGNPPPSPAVSFSPTLTHQPSTPSATEEATRGTFGSLPPAPQLICPLRAGRYQILGELGRGGMGEVLRAFDSDLRRPLAIKVMLTRHQADSDAERRFLEEAQVTGQLQHPGVPPVHEIGRLDDGRPFLAMKLIEGHTLDHLLKERQTPAAELPRFVAIFGHICQCLAYAHSKGVIHRDLKPANVIVGAFGEVQVMDWGLAKVLAAATDTAVVEASSIQTVRSEDPAEVSLAGSILGTPAYMAPEQARGEVDRLDARCDVFGLGAILCAVLTGQPPFRNSDVSDVLRRAAQGDLSDALARLASCGADAELVRLAERCLAAEREQRPGNAGEVAAAVEAYQAGVQERLKRAEMERARAEVKRAEERKRRRLALALAVAAVAVVGLGGVFAWWSERKQAELERQEAAGREERARHEEQARQGVETALTQAVALRQRALWRQADKVLERAAALVSEQGLDDLKQRVAQARADLRFVERLDRIREDKGLIVANKLNTATAPLAYERVFHEHGLDIFGSDAEEVVRRLANSAIKEELIAALDEWSFTDKNDSRCIRLWQITARLHPIESWRQRLAAREAWYDRQAFERLLAGMDLSRLSPPMLAGLGLKLDALGGDGVALLERACLQHPGDFWLNFDLANLLRARRRWDEAAGYNRAALAARPRSSAAYTNLGLTLSAKKDPDGALAAYRRAIDLAPQNATAYSNLGNALRHKKDLDGAVAACRKAIAINPQYACAYYNLGIALYAKHDLEGAIAAYRKAIELDPQYADAYNNLGAALYAKKDLEGVIVAFRKAITLNPRDASAYSNLGNALDAKKDVNGAVAAHKRAVEIDPQNAMYHTNLASALSSKGDLEGMIAACRRAVTLDPRYGNAYGLLGYGYLQQGRFADARTNCRRALSFLPANHTARSHLLHNLQAADRLLAAENKLPDLLKGEPLPDDAKELLTLARLCRDYKKRHAAAARLYAAAFAADPRLGALTLPHRFVAIRSAALANSGQGADAIGLGPKERARLRQQALDGLRSFLEALTQAAKNKAAHPMVRRSLGSWQTLPDFATIRDSAALSKLPEAERAAWRKLWADVAALLQKTEPPR